MANSGGRVDDCKRREPGAKPLRRVSSTGLRHGSPESKVPTKPGVQEPGVQKPGVQEPGVQDIQSPYRVVSRTPMKAVMVTSMGEGDRAVRPFTLRGNGARSGRQGRTWQTNL